MRHRSAAPVCLTLVLAFVLTLPASAQIPDEFTNLQLLDPEIDKRDLVGTMKDWASGLGVRCNHCHVGPEDLVGMDFASDEKATKRTARRMLEMSRAINGKLMSELPVVVEAGRERHQVVSCFTCHRGLSTPPRNTVRVLSDVAVADGPDAAVEKFRELQMTHGGAGQYDLRSGVLDQLAVLYAQREMTDEARSLLLANLELHPESADTHLLIGMLEMRTGNAEAARASFLRTLELVPDHPGAVRALAALEAQSAHNGGDGD